MKWVIGIVAMVALLLSGYAVYRTRRIEAASKPQVHLIAEAPH